MATTATSRAAPTRWRLPLILGILGVLVGISFLTNAGVTSVELDFGLGFYWLAAGVIAGAAIGVVIALLATGRSGDEQRTRSRAEAMGRSLDELNASVNAWSAMLRDVNADLDQLTGVFRRGARSGSAAGLDDAVRNDGPSPERPRGPGVDRRATRHAMLGQRPHDRRPVTMLTATAPEAPSRELGGGPPLDLEAMTEEFWGDLPGTADREAIREVLAEDAPTYRDALEILRARAPCPGRRSGEAGARPDKGGVTRSAGQLDE